MSTTRLYVPVPVTIGETLPLDGDRAHYLGRVMRVRRGDSLIVFNGRGGEYRCSVSDIEKHRVIVVPEEYLTPDVESDLYIRLVQGISRGDRMDAVVQKATELGVHRISPVSTEFSVVRLQANRAGKKTEHWQRIVQGACEQCGRNTVPVVDEPVELPSLISGKFSGTRIVLLPGSERPLTELPASSGPLTLLIGPEGGFSDRESALALDHGFIARSLGPRTLRTETAAIAAIAILQSCFGDIGRAAKR